MERVVSVRLYLSLRLAREQLGKFLRPLERCNCGGSWTLATLVGKRRLAVGEDTMALSLRGLLYMPLYVHVHFIVPFPPGSNFTRRLVYFLLEL